jgi:hypothetical protein
MWNDQIKMNSNISINTHHFCNSYVDGTHHQDMKTIHTLIIALLCLLMAEKATAQFSIGTWRDHLPYGQCVDVCEAGKLIYVATPYSIFTYNKSENELTRVSKATQLTDVGITAMEFDPLSGWVVVGYNNGNLDFINDKSSFSIPDIKFSSVIGDKAIYDILPYQNRVYLSTGFGVVVIDMERLEVKETYFIGSGGGPVKVYDIAIFNNIIYAATETGMQTASLSNNFLANFQNWSQMQDLPGDSTLQHVEFFNNHMLVVTPGNDTDTLWKKNMSGGNWEPHFPLSQFKINQIWTNQEWLTVSGGFGYYINHYNFDYTALFSSFKGNLLHSNNCIIGEFSQIWVADKFLGLLWSKNFVSTEDEIIKPDGPRTAACRRIGAYNNNVWIAHGGVRPDWGNLFQIAGVSGLVDGKWRNFNPDTMVSAGGGFNPYNSFMIDFMDVAVDPLDNNRVASGSWDDGLVSINATTLTARSQNGTETTGPDGSGADWAEGWTGVAGVAYDKSGILWCTNSYTSNALHALDRNGVFYDYDFSPTIENGEKVGDLIITQNGYVWANVIGRGLLVLNNNATLGTFSDDNFKLLTEDEGNGKLASNDVLSMEEDLDGEVWVGTSSGLSIFYNPDAIFTDQTFDSEQILIEQDGNIQVLLETETINCIEIDGSNRKWIGTQNSGVYLLSDDGLREVYHFTEENSPLLSNTVYDIAINHGDGEVFFATENGVIGFFSTATNFDEEMSNVRVFPNPVRPEYDGIITIDGLAYNTSVKITDIQGNIVFETESEGGRAVWNGLRADGARPATGVYLVYVSTPNGSADEVRKLTFIR